MDIFQIEEPDEFYPWKYKLGCRFEQDTLCFTLFHVDPYITKEVAESSIIKAEEEISSLLSPYSKHYPWFGSCPSLKIAHHEEFVYLYGSLVYGDDIETMWLIISILQKYSCDKPDIFVHFFDQDGEFLLSEAAENLSLWLEPDVATNRVWLNNGHIRVIPNEFMQNEGLKLGEALQFLKKKVFKVAIDPLVDGVILETCKQYPKKALERMHKMHIRVSPSVAETIINNSSSLTSRAVHEYMNTPQLDENTGDQHGVYGMDIFLSHSAVSRLHYSSLSVGAIISRGIDLLQEMEPELFTNTASQTVDEWNEEHSGYGPLQKVLKERGIIQEFVEEAEVDKDKGEDKMNELQEKLVSIFSEGADFKEVQEDEGSDSDYDQHEMDNLMRQLEKDGITEDDFFEFFCTQELGLSNDQMESFLRS